MEDGSAAGDPAEDAARAAPPVGPPPAPSAPPAGRAPGPLGPAPGDTAGSLAAGLGLLSVVLLSYEVVQLRVFAYSLHPALTWSAIAVTLLGFGVAGTVLGLSRRLREAPLGPLLAVSCLGFAAAGLLANAVFARASASIRLAPTFSATFTAATLGVVVLCALPYVFGGLAVAAVLSRRVGSIGRLYAVNLLGSGLGCFAVNLVLRPLGAGRLTMAVLALGALAGAVFAGRGSRRLRLAAVAATVVLAVLLAWAPRLFRFVPDASDVQAVTAAAYRAAGVGEPRLEYSQWDPVGRIEVHSWPGRTIRTPDPVPYKLLTQDGGASSVLIGFGAAPPRTMRLFDDTLYGVAHRLRPGGQVLVIGLGGGPDVQAALHHGARRVIAVEINEAVADAVTGPFAQFIGDPFGQRDVRVVVQDGRSWVRATDRRFDVLQMSGTDTLTVQSSGSFVLAEAYLYTVEAFVDYLRVLRPGGVLSILRFGLEPYRLGAIAVAALRRLGVARPDRCVVVLSQSQMKLTLVKREPWTAAEIDEIDTIVARSGKSNAGIEFAPYDNYNVRLGAPLELLYAPGHPRNRPDYALFFARLGEGRPAAPSLVPTDDRPYYFASDLANWFSGRPIQPGELAQIRTYVGFTASLVVVALLAILAPLAVFRLRGLRVGEALPALAYFLLLGFCYMFLEVGLLQKTTLVVEHPARSVSVVLASLLLSSALGSWLSERLLLLPRLGPSLSRGRLVGVAALAVALVGGAYALWADRVFDACLALPLGVRMAAVAALIAPLGTAMGMFFPTGLRRLGDETSPLVPWAIGVNGFASVTGTVLSLPFAVVFGFSRLIGFGVALYVLAALAFLLLPRR